MKRFLFCAATAAMLVNATSCQNDETIERQEGQMFTLEAAYGTGTRTTLEENGAGGYATKWSADDKIYVTDGYGLVSGVLTLKNGEGESTGTFTGYVSGNPAALRYAVFPAPTNGQIDLSEVDASKADAPMTAPISGSKANFKNECGLVRIAIFNLPENADVRLSAEGITGDLQVNTQNGVVLEPSGTADEIRIKNAKNGQAFFVPVIATDNAVSTQFTLSINGKAKTFTAQIKKGAVTANGVPEIYFSDGEIFEKTHTVVSSEDELKDAIAAANPGAEIVLAENSEYGTITIGELKDVTIEGDETSKARFVTTSDSKIKDVTIKGVGFEFVTGAGQKGGAFAVIDAAAQIENLVIENCTIVGDGKKNSYGIYGQNPNASIVVKNCNFSNLGYAIQTIAAGGYKSLTVEKCAFDGIVSWAILPQYGYSGNLTITGCTFNNTKGGLIKTGDFNGSSTFTFTNNTITNSTGHDGKDSKWFEVNASAATKVISGNTKDGAAWTPGETEGLK